MNTNVEQEVKLQVPRRFDLSALQSGVDGYTASTVEAKTLRTTYFDTDDLRLVRWGCSLRYRKGDGWTLKLPCSDNDTPTGLRRAEHVFPDEGLQPPAPALELASGFLRGKPVHPVAKLRTVRKSIRLHGIAGEDIAEVVDDDVRVMQDGRVADRFREVEIELLAGAPADALPELTRWLQNAGAGAIDLTPKNIRALGPSALAPTELQMPQPTADSPASDVVRFALASSVEQLLRSDAALRLNMDPETVHKARVATRRLRSDLRSFLPLLQNEWARALRDNITWLADELGSVRDADVLVARLRAHATRLPAEDTQAAEAVIDRFEAQSTAARQKLLGVLRDKRYVDLLEELVSAAADPKTVPMAQSSARTVIADLVERPWKKLCKTMDQLGEDADDDKLHKVRIKAKRCRYAAEAVSPVGGKAVTRFAKRMQKVQTILGDLHDAVVAEHRLRQIKGDPEEVFVAGGLAAMESQAANEARASWRKAWKKAAKKSLRFWL